jgi:DNA polymerase III subunit gamma/tau
MKWATNKRLHFELGIIKAIQTLGEVRITDVIKVLTRSANAIPGTGGETAPTPAPTPQAAAAPTPVAVEKPKTAPVTAPKPAAKPAPASTGLAGLDSLIDTAPDESPPLPEPEAPPWNEEPKANPAPPPLHHPLRKTFSTMTR